MKKRNIIIKPGFFIVLAVMVFFLDYKTLLAAIISVAAHELGHLSAMKLFNIKTEEIAFSCAGMNIEYNGKYTPYLYEIAVAFSGPAANIILALISGVLYKETQNNFFIIILSISAAVGVFNLLPIKYLDGGKIIYSVLALFFDPQFSEKFLIAFSKIFIVLILFFGIYLFYKSGYNFTLLISALWLLCVVNK